jgi:hypothetical protein
MLVSSSVNTHRNVSWRECSSNPIGNMMERYGANFRLLEVGIWQLTCPIPGAGVRPAIIMEQSNSRGLRFRCAPTAPDPSEASLSPMGC